MLINLRGTSGSGKSHLVRELVKLYKFRSPIYESITPLRPRAVGSLCGQRNGSWELATLTCDLIGSPRKVATLVRQCAGAVKNVLWEGLIASVEVTRAIELSKEYPLLVIVLTEDIETALASVRARRGERGVSSELGFERADRAGAFDSTHTIRKFKDISSAGRRLIAGGVRVEYCSREQALTLVRRELGV